jgi:cysteinyl-tRNA synthetase
VTEINRAKDANEWGRASELAAELKKLGGVLGVLSLQPDEFLQKTKSGAQSGLSDADVDRLIAERRTARATKNFKESDRIRDELLAAGIILEDKPDRTTTWRRA